MKKSRRDKVSALHSLKRRYVQDTTSAEGAMTMPRPKRGILVIALLPLAALIASCSHNESPVMPRATGQSGTTTQEISQAFVEWARKKAIPISTIDPGQGFEDLQPLKTLIGDARVVGLGESVHGAHEFFVARHRLFEFLVEEMGFTAFAGETEFVQAVKVNEYILGQAEEPEKWSNWITGGIRAWEEVKALVRWMRRYNENPSHSRKLHFYGVDFHTSYTSPLAAIEGTWTYLDEVDPGYAAESRQVLLPLVERFLEQGEGLRVSVKGKRRVDKYTRLPMEARTVYTVAVADLVARFETREVDYLGRSSEEAYQWAYRHAIVARELDQQFRALASAGIPQEGPPVPGEALIVRERAMADNLLWALEQEGPDGRIALWAHNTHVQKVPLKHDGYGRKINFTRLGQFLNASIGDDYISLGFTYYQGAQSGWYPYQTEVRKPARPGSLDAELARVGLPMFILDLRAAPKDGPVHEWLNRLWEQRESVPDYFPLNPLQAWDALFYIDQISPVQGSRFKR